jgi:hypothetical protein
MSEKQEWKDSQMQGTSASLRNNSTTMAMKVTLAKKIIYCRLDAIMAGQHKALCATIRFLMR